MKNKNIKRNKGFIFIAVMITSVVLMVAGIGLLRMANGAKRNASKLENKTVALIAAEAGYEQACFWMTKQQDLFEKIKRTGNFTGSLKLDNSTCQYSVDFFGFAGSKPIYKIKTTAKVGRETRTIEVKMAQATGGWEMGMCRIPTGTNSTGNVYFVSGEIIHMPVHINSYGSKYDSKADINIKGSPRFDMPISLSESRYSSGGYDKYSGYMHLFKAGVDFLQPDSQIVNETIVSRRIDNFKNDTKLAFRFKPAYNNKVKYSTGKGAVQLEFYVSNGKGKVRITNNCTVVGYKRTKTRDYKIKKGSGGTRYERYNIYAFHYIPTTGNNRLVHNVTDTYVSQQIGGYQSNPGGQIFVDGDVIIGGNMSDNNGDQLVKGKITIVATGNIWIADSIKVDGLHNNSNYGLPDKDNPNAVALMAGGVVKVVDPGMPEYHYYYNRKSGRGIPRYYNGPKSYTDVAYEPIGRKQNGKPANSYHRVLPDPMIIEAAITVGGGGFGAENVRYHLFYGGRKEYNGSTDYLVVRGALTEAIRGIVGSFRDGYRKKYYMDKRFLKGIIPGNIWLKSKFIPVPAGWSDYDPEQKNKGKIQPPKICPSKICPDILKKMPAMMKKVGPMSK